MLFVRLTLVVLLVASCGSDGTYDFESCDTLGEECLPEANPVAGDWARACSVVSSGDNACLGVCNQRANEEEACGDKGDCFAGEVCVEGFCYVASSIGQTGDFCEFDGDCDSSFTCDNDSLRGSSCRCIPKQCDVPSQYGIVTDLDMAAVETVAAEELWHTKWSCCDERGESWNLSTVSAIFRDQDVATDTRMLDVADQEERSGKACGPVFSWALLDSTQTQNGAFTFASESDMDGVASGILLVGPVGRELEAHYECNVKGALGTDPLDPPTCTFPCPEPEFDITGEFQERSNCDEEGVCVVDDETRTVVIRQVGEGGQYEIGDPNSDWMGQGVLCGKTFRWSAQTANYEELGIFQFSSASSYTKTSDYFGDGAASCTGEGLVGASPPPPESVGSCD